MQSLGTGGQAATDSWSALRTLLQHECSPAHAALLAEPVGNPVRSEIDWYTETDATPQRLTSLPAPRQQAVRQELRRLTGDIQALMERMRKRPREGDRFLAAMLELAMQLPDESYIYLAGEQPVLVAWGHAKAGPAAEHVRLGGELRVSAGPMEILPPPVSPVRVERTSWVAAGLCTAAALLLLLLAAYVARYDPYHWYNIEPAACEVAPGQLDMIARLHSAEGQETELRLQLAQLTTDAAGRRGQCPPLPPPPTQPSSDERRATERGAQHGKVTVILAWDDRNDLDLHILCPDGDQLSYHRRNACGGALDVDANGDSRVSVATPVENAYFTAPIPGRYRVLVDPYAMRVNATSAFRVTIKQESKPDQLIQGVAVNGEHMREVGAFVLETAQ